jgi:hypothetical protein
MRFVLTTIMLFCLVGVSWSYDVAAVKECDFEADMACRIATARDKGVTITEMLSRVRSNEALQDQARREHLPARKLREVRSEIEQMIRQVYSDQNDHTVICAQWHQVCAWLISPE